MRLDGLAHMAGVEARLLNVKLPLAISMRICEKHSYGSIRNILCGLTRQDASALQQCTQTHKLGLGGENIADLVCDKLDELLGKSSKGWK